MKVDVHEDRVSEHEPFEGFCLQPSVALRTGTRSSRISLSSPSTCDFAFVVIVTQFGRRQVHHSIRCHCAASCPRKSSAHWAGAIACARACMRASAVQAVGWTWAATKKVAAHMIPPAHLAVCGGRATEQSPSALVARPRLVADDERASSAPMLHCIEFSCGRGNCGRTWQVRQWRGATRTNASVLLPTVI